MLIESFAPKPDAGEIHKIGIAAAPETVYQALWTADLAGSPISKGLMTLRSLPDIVLHSGRVCLWPSPSKIIGNLREGQPLHSGVTVEVFD